MSPWKLTTKLRIIRKAAPSTEGNRNGSQSPVLRAGADTFIDNSIQAVNAVSTMGSLFPPLKATADMLNVVLNNVRHVRGNQASLQDLVSRIAVMIIWVNARLRPLGEAANNDTSLKQLCDTFTSDLSTLKDELNAISTSSLGKRTLHMGSVSRLIAKYETRMNDLRFTFAINLLRTNTNHQNEDHGILGDLDTSDYYKFKPADIYSIENFTPIHRKDLVEESLVRVDGKSDIYMFRRYIGNDALATFLGEFKILSSFKHSNIPQIFGLCNSKLIPGILFQGKLIRLREYMMRTRTDTFGELSWRLLLSNGYRAVAPYFGRLLNLGPYDGVYPETQLKGLDLSTDIYIDISTDEHSSMWPIPEPHGLMKRYRPVLVAERTPPLQLAMVLRRHPLPSDTDIRPLLAWFYDAMLYVTQKPVDISLPLPLINTNEVYVMGAHGIRRFAFLVPFLSMYKSGSWEIKKPFHHQVEAVNMDKWTRITILPRTRDAGASFLNIIGRFSLPDSIEAFRAFLPQVCQLTDGGALPFNVITSIAVDLSMPHWFKTHPSQPNLKAVYCFVCHLDFTHHGDTEMYWSLDPNGQSRIGKEEICRLGLDHVMTSAKAQCYSFTDLQLKAIKAFHEVCGYGGEDGEERLLSLLEIPRTQFVPQRSGYEAISICHQ